MTDRRSGPPLFDLMRERERKPNAPQRPEPKTPGAKPAPPQGETEKPAPEPHDPADSPQRPRPAVASAQPTGGRQVAWDTSGGVSRAERSAAAMLDQEPQADSGISMSTPRFYMIIAVALVLVVGAWAGGYQLGKSDGRAEMSRFVPDQPVVSPQPGATQPAQPRVSENTENPSPPPQATIRQPVENQTPSTVPPGALMTPDGFVTGDPREPGMNYLVLATLPSDQARSAIEFMNANGVPVIGVPQLDSRVSSANNPSRYTLYSLGLAIPGNRWSSMSAQRRDHEQLAASLGSRWQREERGGSDFSQTNWEKYEP